MSWLSDQMRWGGVDPNKVEPKPEPEPEPGPDSTKLSVASLTAMLRPWLGSETTQVAEWAFQLASKDINLTGESIMDILRWGSDTTTEGRAASEVYQKQFPGMKQLLQGNKLGADQPERAYMAYLQTAQQQARVHGVDESLVARAKVSDYMLNDVSASELDQRMAMASEAVYQMSAADKALFKTYYNVDEGDLTSYYLDPDNVAPMLQQRSRAVSYAATGHRFGVEASRAQAEWLASQVGISGVGDTDAGFARMAAARSLTAGFGETLTEDVLFKGAFGDPAMKERATRLAQARANQFRDSSGVDVAREGVSALGSNE